MREEPKKKNINKNKTGIQDLNMDTGATHTGRY